MVQSVRQFPRITICHKPYPVNHLMGGSCGLLPECQCGRMHGGALLRLAADACDAVSASLLCRKTDEIGFREGPSSSPPLQMPPLPSLLIVVFCNISSVFRDATEGLVALMSMMKTSRPSPGPLSTVLSISHTETH